MEQVLFELEDDFSLIGIHSTEEDYRLAYLLNQHLNAKFKRFKNALDFKNSDSEYPLFEYVDCKSLNNYYLINNKCSVKAISETAGLFGGNYSKITYLIPEKKEIDYFYKIDGCNNPVFLQKLVTNLKQINQIITCYLIDPNTLKSKNHLIF
ncbi:MAG: IPExxxVDY family protein [Lutibacter sp.]